MTWKIHTNTYQDFAKKKNAQVIYSVWQVVLELQ